ncbi:hypothetical protein INT44_007751 [Umbelopsis vinacea]|uniref:Heterokaryon incompatibility domain-containing protein n=1 Tax=Umbelopsis vinacea TaxID=44442 RepID=A0A8H7PJR6_9FUNG|nr:hypothetical protein INT44_007751 [Umbelopsis vinacea]
MSSSVEREIHELQITEGERLINEISSYLHIGGNVTGKRALRAQWFDDAVKGDIISIRRLLQLGADIGREDYEKTTALHLASKSGHNEVVELLIEHGAVVDAKDDISYTALHWATLNGHQETVDQLIKHGAAVASREDNSDTPLHLAAQCGHKEVVDLLIKHGSAVDVRDENSYTALHLAARNGYTKVVDLLMKHGAAVDLRDLKSNNALHLVAVNGHKEVADMLIKHGAAVESRGMTSNNALHLAAVNGHKEVADLLIKRGAYVDRRAFNSDTALHFAAFNGHKAVVDLLIERSAVVDARNEDSETPLHLAAFNGHKEIVDQLIKHGAFVDAKNEDSQYAIHLAAKKGHKHVVDLLVKHGATVDAKGFNSNTALHEAARSGHEEVVDLLIKRGADVATRGLWSYTALHFAAKDGHKGVVDVLIEHGAIVDAKDGASYTALHSAARYGHNVVVDLLIKHGVAVDTQSSQLHTALHCAALFGHKDVVDLLIRHGAFIDAKDEASRYAIHLAAKEGHKEVVDLLIKHGAAVDAKDENSYTALHVAAMNGHNEVVDLLIKHGVAVDAKDENSYTALHVAAMNGHKEVVDMLIQHGAKVVAGNEGPNIALHLAASNGHEEVIGLLIKHGAVVDARNDHSDTALHLAAQYGHQSVVSKLIDHGADVDAQNYQSGTALQFAALNEHTEVVNLLIKHGANIETANINGHTPLMIAVKENQLDMVSLLIEKKANIEASDNTSLTSLHWSAMKGQLSVLQLLLQKNANIDATTIEGDTALHLAAIFNHSDIVATLIDHHANIEAENKSHNTPMQLALLNGHDNVVDQLKSVGARIGKFGNVTSEHLYQAALTGQVTPIRKTLEMCGNEDEKMFYLNATLQRAAQNGQVEVVTNILQCGADIESLNEDGVSPLFLAGQYPGLISVLVHHGACIKARNKKDRHQSVLHHYASKGQMEGLSILLNCGFDIHIIDKDSDTALHYAARIGNCEVVDILLQRGADINAKNDKGENALHCATGFGDFVTVDLLLQQGVDINAKNDKGETSLHIAVKKNMLDITSVLIDNGIDIDAKHVPTKSTALHLAIEARNFKLISLLVRRHADVNAINGQYKSALYVAAKKNLIEACALLLAHDADVNASELYGRTPLYCAVKLCNANLVSLLLDYGASVSHYAMLSGNVLKYAIGNSGELKGYDSERKFIAVIKLLVEAGADTSKIVVTQALEKRFPTLRDVLSKSSNENLAKEYSVFKRRLEIEDARSELSNQVDIALKEYKGSSSITLDGDLANMRELKGTKHKYGSGFPQSKRLLLDDCADIDAKEADSMPAAASACTQPSKPFDTMSIDERATATMKSLLDYVGARFFASDYFFMLESDKCIDIKPPSWASHFDKMRGIIREPGRLIVQIPTKNTSLSVPTWYKAKDPYLQFIDAVYVCKRSSVRPSQEAFSDILGGSEQNLAVHLHAILIAGLSILSIAGGDGLVERLVKTICNVILDPIQGVLPPDSIFSDWQIRNRCRCHCNADSPHRPLSPIAAAKAVGMNVWRERHPYIVNRVWDLKQDILVDDIDYAWIDTICIDKSNLSELDEAIRSMYKWYANCAAVVLDSGTTLGLWSSRGWCLQEGAAAGILCGISKDGKLATIQELAIEQKQDLCTLDLHLYYRPGNAAEILARMDVRMTARAEDRTYALIGIFSIDLALSYGEGLRSRARLLHQLAIQKGDLSFLSFHTDGKAPHHYLPSIDETNYLIAKCTRASAPVTVSHFGICFEVQLVNGEAARQLLEKLNCWVKMSFAKDRFQGVEELIKVGEHPEYQRSPSVELAIVHDIRSLMLVQIYGQDMQTGGGKPIKLCYPLQCCQIEETEFERLFSWYMEEPKHPAAESEELEREDKSKAKVVNGDYTDDDIQFERIWLGDMPNSAELSSLKSESAIQRGRRRRRRYNA